MAKQKKTKRDSYLRQVGGGQEWREGFGNAMNNRTDRAPDEGSYARRISESDRPRQSSAGKTTLFDRLIRFIDEKIAIPLLDWIGEGMPEDPERVARFQQELKAAGQYDGPVDGTVNESFRAAIEGMQA